MTLDGLPGLMHPLPEDFLQVVAQEKALTHDETNIFMAAFSCHKGGATLPTKEQVCEKMLHISAKTFDAHFTRIYQKLGIEGQRPNKFRELYDLLRRRYNWQRRALQILQMPPLPGHFVERPQHQQAVLDLLLCQDPGTPGTLVVSAIYGLGGIGKSVLAAALAHNPVVQARFPDGILWVTLGQNPDILPLLSGWVQALRDYHFKPISVEATTTHLRTLLSDKQVLLVVDDVWDVAHLDPFRVGRGQSRVLVTTRSAPITDALRYDLDVMTPAEALAMLTKQLGKSLTSSEQTQALDFAEQVGYLPLALELAAAQVKDGTPWATLLATFQQEVVRLGTLDLLSAEELTEESTRRRYSLIACFNLSLRQLAPEQLRQFAWLGVLPDDVAISRAMTSVLWQVTELQAGAALRGLRGKALLRNDVTRGDQRTYRMHGLLHDLAMKLLVAPMEPAGEAELPGLGLGLAAAHQQFLDCYRTQKTRDRKQWHTLADDGYIHAHLTWHMVQAGRSEAVHALLQETTEAGRNGWFETCEALGQPAIFVRDLGRGWKLAERLGDERFGEALLLLWRYALIRGTLNSLTNNIPPELIGALVAKGIWSPAQGLAYAKLAQTPEKIAKGIKQLTPYLPEILLFEALKAIQTFYLKAEDYYPVFCALAARLPGLWANALEATRQIQDEQHRAIALQNLAPHLPKALQSKALEITCQIQDERHRAVILRDLAPHLSEAMLSKFLETTHQIRDNIARTSAINVLVPYLPEKLRWTFLNMMCQLQQHDPSLTETLCTLAPHLPETLLNQTLKAVCRIKDDRTRASAFLILIPYLPETLLSCQTLEVTMAMFTLIKHKMHPDDKHNLYIEYPNACFDSLCILAPYLPKTLFREALEEAMCDVNTYTRSLWALAPHLVD